MKTTKPSGLTSDKNETDIEHGEPSFTILDSTVGLISVFEGKVISARPPAPLPLDLEGDQQHLPEQLSGDSESMEDVEPLSILAIPQGSISSAESDSELHNVFDDAQGSVSVQISPNSVQSINLP